MYSTILAKRAIQYFKGVNIKSFFQSVKENSHHGNPISVGVQFCDNGTGEVKIRQYLSYLICHWITLSQRDLVLFLSLMCCDPEKGLL